MDFRFSVGLTIGDPEMVGALANCFFQIWHGIFLANDPPSPGQKTCSRRVNEILTGRRKPSVARGRPKGGRRSFREISATLADTGGNER
jgi:hypothetical protein